MQHPETDTGPSSLHWGEKEQTVSTQIPFTTGVVVSHNSGDPASEGNPASYVLVDGSNNMSSVLVG